MKMNQFRCFLKSINRYAVFLILVGFVTTCSTMLFVHELMNAMDVELTGEMVGHAAKLTLINVFLISLIFYGIDVMRRKWMLEMPAKRITDAAKSVMEGDFSVRIECKEHDFIDESFQQIIECFNTMIAELGSVETLRTDFISNVSHEMKTPLSVIQNYGTLLQMPDLSEHKRLEYAKGVSEGSKRMADLMSNILKLNRLENQQIFPKKDEFDLGEQLCECLLQYENIWEEKKIEVEVEIEPDVIIKGDKELLSLVWNNLFSNAFKFTEAEGLVKVQLLKDDHYAVVKVSDTGCGISPEVGTHLFEKFYQGDTSHASQGNGLGLALVKRVVDILQAEIMVESELHKGTVFTVKIGR